MSPAAVPHKEKVCSIVRQIYGRSPTDDLKLRREQRNLLYIYIYERYTPSCSSSWSRLYGESTIYQESTPDHEQSTWRSTTLLCDKVIEITNDSVLCLGSISDEPVEALKLEAKNGHINFICLQQQYLTRRKSVRSYDKFMAEVQRMTRMTSTTTTQFVVYIYERYTPSCSSSWSRLYGESTIYQESTPDYEQPTWRSTTLLFDKVIEITNDSVLCLGSISDQPVEALKLEAKNGHINFICLQRQYLTRRKSVRSYDKFMAEVQRMTWMTSTRTTKFVVYIYMNVTLQAAVHHGRDYM